jgi:hypothetical protein
MSRSDPMIDIRDEDGHAKDHPGDSHDRLFTERNAYRPFRMSDIGSGQGIHPTSHLAYHLVAGTQCWFAGYPAHRDLAVAKKKVKRVARLSKSDRSDESPPAQALPDAGNTSEPSSGRPENTQSENTQSENTQSENTQSENTQSMSGIADAFNVVESDTNSVEPPRWRVLGLSDRAVEVSETRQPPLVVWLLLTVGIGTTIAAILKFYGDRLNARLMRATPLVNYVDTVFWIVTVLHRTSQSRAHRCRHHSNDFHCCRIRCLYCIRICEVGQGDKEGRNQAGVSQGGFL